MLNDLRLARLIRAAEVQNDRESEAATPRKAASAPLPKELTAPIISYLLDPYEHGFWELRAAWNPSSPFAKHLIDKLSTLSEIEVEPESSPFIASSASKRLSEEKRSELLRVSNRLSSINSVFRAALKNSEGGPINKFSELDSWIGRINLSEIPINFPDAWNIFKEKIYFEGFSIGIDASKPYRTKSGLVLLLEAPRQSGVLHVVATGRNELIALSEFYSSLGAIKEHSVRRVFAPDDDLFKPYFPLVSSVLTHVVHDGQISRLFSQALAYYEEDDFQHCISSLGLIAEDYLQRIYTTLLREPLPGGLTLGQTVERLHKRVEDLLPQQKITQKSPDPLYEKINSLDQNSNADQLKPILRELLGLLIDDRHYNIRKLDEATKNIPRKSVFPQKITDRLNEMLKWRNAASHNSRIPLGAHEADRTLFCLIGTITWWQDQLSKLDWSQERIALIETLLQESKSR